MLFNPTDLELFVICAVHEIRPADIKVVAAVGDSLTVSASLLSAHTEKRTYSSID